VVFRWPYAARVTLPDWLDPSTLRDVALLTILAFGLTAIMIIRFVQRVAVRVVLIALLGALSLAIYTQRTALADCADECECTFFAFDVEVPGCARRFSE